jgi:hypothetical protein
MKHMISQIKVLEKLEKKDISVHTDLKIMPGMSSYGSP